MSTQIIERMAVEVDGRGTAIVLVHGLGGTSNTFTPQLAVLDSRFRLIRPDLPGSGRSPAIEKPAIQAYVDRIARMTEVLGVERAHFVGHSLGTIVCQHLAVQHPRLVRSLALLGPLTEPPEAARQGLRERAQLARSEGMAPIADAVVQGTLSNHTRSSQPLTIALVREMLMRQCPEGYARTCEALAQARGADLHAIRCPTLLLAGDDDPVAPPSTARILAERIENARATVLNRCGHWTMFERVEAVNAALRDFYARGF